MNKKKGIYIRCGSKTGFAGVQKKINDQIGAFSRIYDMRDIVVEKADTNAVRSILWRVPGGSFGRRYTDAIEEIEEFSGHKELKLIYIRQQPFDKAFVMFIKELRTIYSNAKILMEVPTYPYASELLHNSTMWPWYFKDLVYNKRIGKFLDRVVTYSKDDMIFGVPTIQTMNGINVESIRLAETEVSNNDTIRMIAVAMMQPYHGFERLIKGLESYYKNSPSRRVELVMVGYGSELSYYKDLTEKCKLSDIIEFKGKLIGEELDAAYNGCDIAIGSMGGYKIGIEVFSSIKLGEYLAKGLPVITGARTLVFDKCGHDFNLEFPNNDSEIDVNKIVDFYDRIYVGKDKKKVRTEIRQLALENIDVSVTMKSILDYLENS